METFLNMIETIGKAPAWLPLIFLPCVLGVIAAIMTVLGGRRFYWYLAAPIGGLGFFLVLCIDELRTAFIFLGLYVTLAALLRLLFFIPCPLTYKRASGKRGGREEKIYRKFREELSEQLSDSNFDVKVLPAPAVTEQLPCVTAEESGTRLNHVTELLTQLRKEELSPTDRLEADALFRSVEAFGGRALTEEEMGVLNDCLAAVLKLTAKYKL